MTTKLVNRRLARPRPGDVSIMRPGLFGNPFALRGDEDAREECLLKYQRYFVDRYAADTEFRRAVDALKDKRLVCCCRPPEGFRGRLRCHGQFIVALLDDLEDPKDVP